MLHNKLGKKIKDFISSKLSTGQQAHAEPSDREEYDVSRGLTPYKLDQIMIAANGGDSSEQSRLCRELEEKNWDICHALETRRNAVMGVGWEVQPGGESTTDKKAAENLKAALQAAGGLNNIDSFNSLLADSMSALLPGFSVSEIVWQEGGGVAGFNFIEQQHFTFIGGKTPRLVTRDESLGIELDQHKYIIHKYRRRGGDVARGGLIRPLAWLHCFSSVNVKDLLSFVERYGMPFVVAKVDDNTWKTERSVMQALIRNFGPSGGGLFTRSTELELLQAANNTGDVYFKLLEYIGMAITKVILGQTAASGDGGGWSADNAQAQVRQDILEADCDALGDTLTMQLAAPWTMYTQAPGTKTPIIALPSVPPEDTVKKYEAIQARYSAMGIAIRAGILTPSEDLEAAAREELDLPEVDTAVKANWTKNKGIKAPITLKDAPKPPEPLVAPNKKDTMSMAADPGTLRGNAEAEAEHSESQQSAGHQTGMLVDNTAAEIINSGAADAWLGPIEKEISNISELSDEELIEKLKSLSDGSDISELFGDSEELQKLLENETLAAAADGIRKKIKELKSK